MNHDWEWRAAARKYIEAVDGDPTDAVCRAIAERISFMSGVPCSIFVEGVDGWRRESVKPRPNPREEALQLHAYISRVVHDVLKEAEEHSEGMESLLAQVQPVSRYTPERGAMARSVVPVRIAAPYGLSPNARDVFVLALCEGTWTEPVKE